jgi:hypothetical protein
MAVLMDSLEYEQWVAQGGDWGADICAVLASNNTPESLKGIHMNTPFFDTRKEIRSTFHASEDERKAKVKEEHFEKYESGYFKLQSTCPQTIGYAFADSPVAQAAWIYEKIHNWTAPVYNFKERQSERHVAELLAKVDPREALSKDEILDNIMGILTLELGRFIGETLLGRR